MNRKFSSPAEVELRRVRRFQERPERPFPPRARRPVPHLSCVCDWFGHWSKQMYHLRTNTKLFY